MKIPDLDELGDASNGGAQSCKAYSITLDGPGLRIERVLTEQQAWTVLSVIFNRPSPATATAPLSSGGSSVSQFDEGVTAEVPSQRKEPEPQIGGAAATPRAPAASAVRESVGEFVAASGAPNNRSKIMVIGAYLKEHHGKEVFTRDEISAQFQRAGEAKPANFHRDFGQAVSKKWIAAADDGASFYITNSGLQAMAGGFKDERRTPTPSGRSKTKKAAEDAES